MTFQVKPSNFDYTFKFIVVGPSFVGKTCLSYQFTDEKFMARHELTVGVEFVIRSIEIDGKKIKIDIWDTAGQESFRAITNSYYRGCHGAIIVYDITRRSTFEHLVTYLDDVRYNAGTDPVILIVGNKCDLEEQREVTKEEAEQFAEKQGVMFLEASAKTAKNVQSAFRTTAETIYHKVLSGEIQLEENNAALLAKKQESGGCCGGGGNS